MKQIVGNIFDILDADAICVTTCGVTKSNGDLVMGAGIAKQFRDRYQTTNYGSLANNLGILVKTEGNHVYVGCWQETKLDGPIAIVSFPTKEHFKNDSQLWLIKQSARELVQLADAKGWNKIVLPRPGCGLGLLDWEKDVKPLIEAELDDRFYIITPGGK